MEVCNHCSVCKYSRRRGPMRSIPALPPDEYDALVKNPHVQWPLGHHIICMFSNVDCHRNTCTGEHLIKVSDALSEVAGKEFTVLTYSSTYYCDCPI